MASIAINGLGRIGRAALKIIEGTGGAEVVAVNDLIPPDNLAYLLRSRTPSTGAGARPSRWPVSAPVAPRRRQESRVGRTR